MHKFTGTVSNKLIVNLIGDGPVLVGDMLAPLHLHALILVDKDKAKKIKEKYKTDIIEALMKHWHNKSLGVYILKDVFYVVPSPVNPKDPNAGMHIDFVYVPEMVISTSQFKTVFPLAPRDTMRLRFIQAISGVLTVAPPVPDPNVKKVVDNAKKVIEP
jgi:hypothetical protein